MEIICAGYPKTGTKSCSAALRKLGYNVADYTETAYFLSYVWEDFIAGKIDIDEVIAEYQKYNFQANQDTPGSLLWEDLHVASPNAKVILTVRDSTETWHKSFDYFFCKQFQQLQFLMEIQKREFMGPKAGIMLKIIAVHGLNIMVPSFNFLKTHWTWQQKAEEFTKCADEAKSGYERHNAHVKEIVQADRLLIWNVKDGWEPLCEFLNQPVPDGPIPHDNKGSDAEFFGKYMMASDYGKEQLSYLKWNISMMFLKAVGLSAGLIYLYKTEAKTVKYAFNSVYTSLRAGLKK